MRSIATLTCPAERDTLSHLPAPGLRQTGRMGEGRGEGSVSCNQPTRQQTGRGRGAQTSERKQGIHVCEGVRTMNTWAISSDTSVAADSRDRASRLDKLWARVLSL